MPKKRQTTSSGIRFHVDPLRPAVEDASGTALLRVSEPPRLAQVRGQRAQRVVAWYVFTGRESSSHSADGVLSSRAHGGDFDAELGGAGMPLTLRAKRLGPRTAQLAYKAHATGDVAIEVQLAIEPGERFFGFGERFNACDQRGQRVSVWAEERSVALPAPLAKALPKTKRNPFPSGPDSTYCPMPLFTSSRNWGLVVEESNRVIFDVGAADPTKLSIKIFGASLTLTLFFADSPLGLIETMTERTGRATLPNPWIFAPWNDAVTGPERVREVANKLRAERIPSAAIWTEDWQNGSDLPFGQYWIFPTKMTVDEKRYPDFENMTRELRAKGYRFLAYFFPYVLEGTADYERGKKRGVFMRDKKGRPWRLALMGEHYGQLDFTHPEAKPYLHEIFARTEKLGVDGWMADFGEYTPVEARFHDGSTGWEMHNRYPLLWQEANRSFWDEARPDGDYVFFCRSGTVGSQRQAPVIWSGDQSTNFDKLDGLPAVIPAALNAGISGVPYFATDLAGYKSFTCGPSDRELFQRWTEMTTFLPVMRTHHGVRLYRNWSFDKDRETLDHYRRYTCLHTALFPHIHRYAAEAASRGLPIVRHLHLHHPDDAEAGGIHDQLLFGEELLVAPIVERGAVARSVYLPAGDWVDLWSGVRKEGPVRVQVEAPIGRIPLFLRTGSVLPTLDRYCDTLLTERVEGIRTLADADESLRVTVAGPGSSDIELADGTTIAFESSDALGGADIRARVVEGRARTAEADDMVPFLWTGVTALACAEGKRVTVELARGKRPVGRVAISSSRSRRYTLQSR